MKLIVALTIVLMVYQSYAASGVFDYAKLGADWTGLCASGKEQSPIDLQTGNAMCDRKYIMDFVPRPDQFSVNVIQQKSTYTIKSELQWADMYSKDVNLNFNSFDAVQFHIHTPSEHTLNGKQYPAEVHFIFKVKASHEQQGGRAYAVLGIFLEEKDVGEESFMKKWNIQDTQTNVRSMNFSKIFNETVHSRKFIGYEGSLTTPPCTEMVNWHVLLEPEHITPAELSYLKTFMGTYGNARQVQPLNGRTVKIGNSVCHASSGRFDNHDLDLTIGITFIVTFVSVAIIFLIIYLVLKSKQTQYQPPSKVDPNALNQ